VLALWLRYQPQARALVSSFFAPFLEARDRLTWRSNQETEFSKTKLELVRELEDYRARLSNQSFAEERVAALQLQNEKLRGMLNLTQQLPYRLVAAHVLVRDPANGGRSFGIDRGADHGVAPGQPVLADGKLLGRVMSTTAHDALVLSITDPNCHVSVRVPNTNLYGIMSGRGENAFMAKPVCKVQYLPRDATYAADLTFETSAYSPQVPPGLPVGALARDEKGELVTTVDNLYKTAMVAPFAFAVDTPLSFVSVVIYDSRNATASTPAAGGKPE